MWIRPFQHSEWDDADGVHHSVDYQGTVDLRNVEAKRNSRGMMVCDYNPTRDDVVLDTVSITDSSNEAIRFDYLSGELNPATFAQFAAASSGKNNNHGFMMYYSNAVLDGLTFTGNRGWGGLAYYSKLTVRDCKFNGNGNGLLCYTWPTRDDFLVIDDCEFKDNSSGYGLQTYFYPTASVANSTFANNKLDGHYSNYDVSLRTENCVFTGNRQWGVVWRVPDWWQYQANEPGFANPLHTLIDCTIEGNANGLHVQHGQNATFKCRTCRFVTTEATIYFSTCQLVLDNQATANWPLENNGWGPLVNGGDVTFRNMTQTVNGIGFTIWGWGDGKDRELFDRRRKEGAADVERTHASSEEFTISGRRKLGRLR
ncbi:MAG: right-handed parallel beta-helix repeat-containing protein [Pirellulaceae bacterium]